MNRRHSLQKSERLDGKAKPYRTVLRPSRGLAILSRRRRELWAAETFSSGVFPKLNPAGKTKKRARNSRAGVDHLGADRAQSGPVRTRQREILPQSAKINKICGVI